jgi:hypothetical protein
MGGDPSVKTQRRSRRRRRRTRSDQHHALVHSHRWHPKRPLAEPAIRRLEVDPLPTGPLGRVHAAVPSWERLYDQYQSLYGQQPTTPGSRTAARAVPSGPARRPAAPASSGRPRCRCRPAPPGLPHPVPPPALRGAGPERTRRRAGDRRRWRGPPPRPRGAPRRPGARFLGWGSRAGGAGTPRGARPGWPGRPPRPTG